jgi:general secretion pathway protein E/type IV pilus assembly protein PilB
MSIQPAGELGEALLHAGLVTADQLHIALTELDDHQALGRTLVRLGFLSEATLRDALSATLGQTSIDLSQAVPEPAALALVPQELARRQHILPLHLNHQDKTLSVAVADINDHRNIAAIGAVLPEPLHILPMLAGESEIDRAIDRHYGHELSIDGILHEIETGEIDWSDMAGNEYRRPIIRLIDALLADAVRREASDIHFEPEAGFLRIRYRIDGMLRQIRALHHGIWPAMGVRLKVLAGMNIAEMRAPQDGRFSLNIAGRQIDFRAACQPTLHGENFVLRILDRQKGIVPLEQLGLNERHRQELQRMQGHPEGLILVTGPTGSGKTTTLYSLLQNIEHEGIHVMTLEDPVEHPLARVRQTSVSEAVRLDFVSGIRSMMRQDPDVILIGEIRDAETAGMAFRAAMTGHQVYSTLHSNSAIGAIPRLRDLGISPEMLACNLIGIVAQRLVRRLCQHCKVARPAEPFELALLDMDILEIPSGLFHPVGCAHCEQTGYHGRLPLMETLRIDETLDELLASQAELPRLRQYARARGDSSLADDGRRLVVDGHTSLAELQRVISLDGR